MAVRITPLEINPQNHLLNVKPLNDAFNNMRKANEFDASHELNTERMGLERERVGLARSAENRSEETRQAQIIGGIAQTIEGTQDPAARSAMLSRLMSGQPRLADTLRKYGVDPSDHINVPRFLIAQTRGYVNPLEDEGARAQIEERRARTDLARTQAEAARERPTTFDLAPGHQRFQMTPDPEAPGGRRASPIATAPPQLTSADRQAVLEADEKVLTTQGVVEGLRRSLQLSGRAYEGIGAETRGTIMGNLGNERGQATMSLSQQTTEQALGQLRVIFGGNPTEGERRILLDMQGAVNQPRAVRDRIYQRAIEAAQGRQRFFEDRAREIRGGTFYGNGRPQGGSTERTTAPTLEPVNTPPIQGANRAPDGFWYVPDPRRPGKFLRVEP